MNIGFIGLGSVVETAYLPALAELAPPGMRLFGFDIAAKRPLPGMTTLASLDQLLALPLDRLFVTTASLAHIDALQAALGSQAPRIVVEKPVAASLEQMARLRILLSDPAQASRVLALDHWTARASAFSSRPLMSGWQAENHHRALTLSLDEIVRIEGYLQEPSGFNARGEPIALNFATGEPDTRRLRHPDGVIVDIGTHVLAMLREILHALGANDTLALELVEARDRLGRPIQRGDFDTAEGQAELSGRLGGIETRLWLNKYAGPAGGIKGLRLHLRDGRILLQDRRDGQDMLEERTADGTVYRWWRDGAIYRRCLAALIDADDQLAIGMTQRRMDEVEALLRLQQDLRGPHP